MIRTAIHLPTTAACDLNEVRINVGSAQYSSFRLQVLKMLVALRVLACNAILSTLQFFLFRSTGYRRRDFKNIVVYTVGILGDNVVMLPAIAALRRAYPSAMLDVLVNCQIWNSQAARDLFQNFPFVDSVSIVNDDLIRRRGARLEFDAVQAPGVKCDLFVNLSPFGNRGWFGATIREIALARKMGATHALGFRIATWRPGTTFDRVQHHFVRNEPRRAQSVLKPLGISPETGDVFPKNLAARESVKRKLEGVGWSGGPVAVLHPGAKFEIKCWPAVSFGELSAWLKAEMSLTPIVTGTTSEVVIAAQVVTSSIGMAISLVGQTSLQELIELLRIATICVTNDTGTMHIAAMVGTPTVALFSTRVSPTHWFPAGSKVVALYRIMECSFCYKDDVKQCSHMSCIRGISVGEVRRAIVELTGRTSAESQISDGCRQPATSLHLSINSSLQGLT